MQEENIEQKPNIEEVEKKPIDNFTLLSKIFYPKHDNPSLLSSIIKSTDDLPYLFYCLKNQEILNYKEKFKILETLTSLFKSNNNLINLFTKKCKSNITNFYEPIIDLYLLENEESTEENKNFLEEMLLLIVNTVSIPKFIMEYIFQKLSIYLRYNTKNEKINKLTKNGFMKYLNLLEIFYTNSLEKDIMKLYDINTNDENNINNYIENEKTKEIKNYLFFNGVNSKITIFLNQNSTNVNCDFPTMQNGFSFVFWINLEQNLIKDYYTVNEGKNINKVMTLISLMFGENQIRVQLINENKILVILDDTEYEPIDISKSFKYDSWNNICITIDNKKSEFIKIIINGELLNAKIDIPKNSEIKFSGKISNISLFENLIGKINSVLICPNTLNNELISYFKESQGFYKIKYLYKFLLSINNNYYQFSSNYKYIEKYKNQQMNKNYLKININSEEQNIKNIVGLFCCFTYNEHKRQIDDVFGNYVAIISSEDDGANNYIKYYKNIEQIGEINNLLPVIELILLSHNKEKLCSSVNNADIEIEDLITEEIFLKYMHIVKKIIKEKKLNLISANNTKFFSHLGLFLEKFPSKIYGNRIRILFYELGKETFQFSDEKSNFSHTFINMILLNEKIFSKFSEENQLILWGDIYKFFTSDYSQLKDSLNMSKICLLLRFYDKDRYTKYCCKRHADLFDNESPENILNPDMNIKVGKLFEIIQLFVDNLSTETETANLFKLLSLDLSPCLQKKVIIVYQKFFDNRRISDQNKEKALDILLSNQFFEIFEYCMSVSLFDVRIQLIELLRILQNEFKNKIDNYIKKNENVIKYITEFLLPDNLKVNLEKENNQNEIVSLNKYFNEEIYRSDINLMYDVLNNWIIYKILVTKKEGNKEKIENYEEANPTAIKIFIQFVSKVSPFYIDCLLILLYSITSNTTINHNKTFMKNDYFYKWLFEVIFFFNNKENEKLVEEKEKTNIESIKSHDIELFKQFIGYKNSNRDKIITYLMDYSFYLKEKNKNDENQIKEITSITRNLLALITEAMSNEQPPIVDILSKICFEFIFLYKDNKNENISHDENKIVINNNLNNNDKNENKIESESDDNLYEDKESSEENNKSNENGNNNINNININNESSNNKSDEHNRSFDDKINGNNNNKNTMKSIFNLILIPDSLINNIFLKEKVETNEQTPNIDNNILNAMWEDFNLYNYIFDYYHDSLWGLEALCRHVGINYDKSGLEIFGDLLKKYTDNKYKNILINMLNRYFNYDEFNLDPEKKTKKTNIFNLILILLCVAYDTTLDNDERTSIENQMEQFLFFCILCSVNITTAEKTHNIIQNRLYDLIGFALLFFKKRNEAKYDSFVEKVIKPLFDGVISENAKKGIKGIFGLPKKAIYKNTAIERLFTPQENEVDENGEIKNEEMNKSLKKGFISKSLNLNINDSNKRSESDKKKDKKEKKNKKKDKNKFTNFKLVFKGDGEIIVKHVIDDTIKVLTEERKKKLNNSYKYVKEFYYQNTMNQSINNEKKKLINEEKERINSNILRIVPDFENNIRKYSSTSLIQEKKRRNRYQKVKKKLFSWRSFWSQKEIFYTHPEYLKLKVKNHFTKEMSKIILSPVLDIDYYFPSFKKFNPEKLFNKDDVKYKINLNIENILTGNEESDNENNEKKEKNTDEIILTKNKYGFNYLECLYKLNYVGLWDQYKIRPEQKIILEVNNNEEDNITLLNNESQEKANLKNTEEKKAELTGINKLFKKDNKKNKIKTKTISIFKCCLVKPTHHLNGYITCNDKKLKFNYSSEEKAKNLTPEEIFKDPSYDKDMNNCFGSTFKTNLKDKDKVNLSIYYKNLKYIFIKKYFYQDTAMEIYTIDNKSYFFNFKCYSDLTNYLSQLLNSINYREIKTEDHKGKKLLGYEQIFNMTEKKGKIKSYYITNKVDEWQNYKISTLEYLMWLNIYSGRSFNDLTQYPVFPWIISNYTAKELEQETDYRNMGLPIGMMELIDNEKSTMRKETFMEIYNTVKNDLKENFHDFNYQDYLKKGEDYFYSYRTKKMKITLRNYSTPLPQPETNPNNSEITTGNNNTPGGDTVEFVEINQLPSYFSSHYSNPTYVCHYMTRVFPFSFISIEIQGEKFDDPNRIFHSMEKTFESCMTLKDDVRELIPEFYYFPEMFKNLNNLNLTQDLLDANGEKIIINDVELPLWSDKKVSCFIIQMRNILENNKTKINKWIDIIFGIFQKGEKAEEIHNLFQAQSYEGMVKIEKIKDIDMRDAMMRLVEVGVTPMQIFDKESKSKLEERKIFKNNIYSLAKGLFLDDKKCKLNKFYITSKNYKTIYHKLYENYKLTDNRDYQEEIFPQIIAIKCINPKNLKIFTNKNFWYYIKISNHDNKPIFEEKNINSYQNNSSKFSPSFPMSISNIPYIIYNNEKYIIKGGFWDSHLEINSLNSEHEKKEKEKEKEEKIAINIFIPMYGPIEIMKMTSDEKLLFCGTKYGNIIIFDVKGPNLKINKVLYDHSDCITSISINETLNMFVTSSKDGYINLYILPSYSMIRSVLISQKEDYNLNYENIEKNKKEEYTYASNIFLSSTPLPCYTIYITEKHIFKTFSINGEFIYKEEESETTGEIKCPIIFKNLYFNDFLIYGTEDGFVKIRSFPDMVLINAIKPFEGQEIKALELSPDKRFCYVWSHKDKIAVIKDTNTSTGFEVKDESGEHEETLMDKIIAE